MVNTSVQIHLMENEEWYGQFYSSIGTVFEFVRGRKIMPSPGLYAIQSVTHVFTTNAVISQLL